MKDKCIDEVQRAAGRKLSADQLKNIEDRIARNQRRLAAMDKQGYLAMTSEMRYREAAKMAAKESIEDAEKAKQRLELSIQKHDVIDSYIASQKEKYGWGPLKSLQHIIAEIPDMKGNFLSMEARGKAVARDYIRQLVGVYETVGPKLLGLFANKDGIKALTYELFGQDAKTVVDSETAALARRAATEWEKVAESARQHFNNAGGKIGRLSDWHIPQSHSQILVARAGAEQWIKDVFGKLNRSKYTNEDGSLMNDKQVLAMMHEVYDTISTGGANTIVPGTRTNKGIAANANAAARSVHFKDAESYMDYQANYGNPDVYSVMMKHIQGLSRDIANIETFGPDADRGFKYWQDKGIKDETLANRTKAGKIIGASISLENLYNEVSGNTAPVASERIARGFAAARNWMIATKLGSAFISAIPHQIPFHLTAFAGNLPQTKLIKNFMTTLNLSNREEEHMANLAGLSLDTMLGEVNRWAQDALGPSFSAKMASAVIRASGLNALNEARHRAFGVTAYGAIGDMVRKYEKLGDIHEGDSRILTSRGITDTDFQVWKKAQLEDWGNGNNTMLTPESIYRIPDKKLTDHANPAEVRREAAIRLLGVVGGEADIAINAPKAFDRAMTVSKFTRGTWGGELGRQFFLFKTYPLGMITSQWMRGLNMPTAGGRAVYISSLIAGTTALGAFATQLYEMLHGRDPRSMGDYKFWIASLLKGGSTGIYGDFLLDPENTRGQDIIHKSGGAILSDMEDTLGLVKGSTMNLINGKPTRFGTQSLSLLKSNIPGQNLWYTQAVLDRLIFNQLQEMVAPGYARRVEDRARREFGQSYYWKPGSVAPDRAPNIGAAVAPSH